MNIIERLGSFLDHLERKDFYKYLGGYFVIITLVLGLILYRYYAKIDRLTTAIDEVNEQRDIVQRMLSSSARIQKQRTEVDELLTQDENFKIGGYFEGVLETLHLKNNKIVGENSHIDHKNNYRESILKIRLVDMDMKQLTELLKELEQNKRIFIKELEIASSKKKHKKIDVSLTIATLETKPASV